MERVATKLLAAPLQSDHALDMGSWRDNLAEVHSHLSLVKGSSSAACKELGAIAQRVENELQRAGQVEERLSAVHAESLGRWLHTWLTLVRCVRNNAQGVRCARNNAQGVQ